MRRNDKYLREVGGRLKAIRKSKRISVRLLGAMCAIDYSNLSRFENGQKDMRISTIKLIADKLGVDVRDFI